MSRLVDRYYFVRSKAVYGGIPINKFSAKQVEDSKVLTFVGRINEQKKVFRLLKAFKVCTETIPEARLNIIAQAHSSTLEQRFTDEIRDLGLGGNVLWNRRATISFSPHNYYHDAQAVVYPTLHEAFGLVVVEAMASGRPVITSNFGGPSEIVSNNKEGILVNPYSEADIAEAMTRLLSDVNLCRDMGRRARAKFERDFSIEHVARSIESHLGATT
jgi:glycosyltransferase involved in cell wall biosynthesis